MSKNTQGQCGDEFAVPEGKPTRCTQGSREQCIRVATCLESRKILELLRFHANDVGRNKEHRHQERQQHTKRHERTEHLNRWNGRQQ